MPVERSNALEILDLPENATTDDVAKRYNVVFKKFKYADIDDKGHTKQQVEEAYRLLMGLNFRDPEAEKMKKHRREHPNPLFKLLRLDEEKARNAIYYYKWWVVIGIVAIVAVVSLVLSMVNRVKPDLKVIVAGEVALDDSTRMEDAIRASVGNIKAPQIQCIILSDQLDAQSQMGYEQKFTVELMAGKNDIYIMDVNTYRKYAAFGVFIPLDDMKDELGIKNNDSNLEVAVVDDNGKATAPPRLYGVDVSESPLLKDCGVTANSLVAALFADGDNPQNAKEYLKKLIESVR